MLPSQPVRFRRLAAFPLLLVAGCGTPPAAPVGTTAPHAPAPGSTAQTTAAPSAARPLLRLPEGVEPTAETIELAVDPERDRFSGKVDIDVVLTEPRARVWLHARELHVTSASIAGAPATWSDEDEHGMGALTVASPVPAGRARIHVEYDAPFSPGTRGVFKAKEAGLAYAFTQFEAIDARRAFPCFDEPRFKIPFSVVLHVPPDATVVANTPEASRAPDAAGLVRVAFAPTKPLPSYLVAFAVGPLDVVAAPDVPPNTARARALPLRAVVPRGRAKDAAYSLGHAGAILSKLEDYFGIAYPYEKLDLLAVPDMGGAMENAGAVTFAEGLLLFDEHTAPVSQRKDYAMVTAHELAHQWFGDLVTMTWWDDTWLNESFAEWMGFKIAARLDPSLKQEVDAADEAVHAMDSDSLVNAREVHQPVASADDIENAFDETTYEKGGAVIAMFERWLGPQTFQKGVALHLSQHAYGSADAGDFLAALSAAAGRDVATPFRTFLDQPGVPYVRASLECDPQGAAPPHVHLSQSRFLPQGSTGARDALWQVPICAKYDGGGGAVKEACTLLAGREGDLALEGAACPAWVFPNAEGAGYYRFSLAPGDLARVKRALPSLDTVEKMAYADSLRAAYAAGGARFDEVLSAAAPLASDPSPRVAVAPTRFVGQARDWLYADAAVRPRIEAYARSLFAPAYARLGWERRRGDGVEAIGLRTLAVGFLAETGRDPRVRAEAKRRALAYIGFHKDGALHREAVDQDLVATALGVAGEEADAATFDAMLALFTKTDDDAVRGALLWALSSARDPELSERARALVLDERVQLREALTPLFAQMSDAETRDAAWAWLKDHWDAVLGRVAGEMFTAVSLVGAPGAYCDEAHAADVTSFLKDRAEKIDGGGRVLAKTIERIRLCAARRAAEEGYARDFFGRR
jgi:alanyl aminopeptidase